MGATTQHNGMTERILDYLRTHDFATRRGLHEELGVKLSAVDNLLERHIDAGIVIVDRMQSEDARPPVACYRWNAEAVAGTKPRQHRQRSAPRNCLCCGQTFLSAGSMNRLCARCRARAGDASPYAV